MKIKKGEKYLLGAVVLLLVFAVVLNNSGNPTGMAVDDYGFEVQEVYEEKEILLPEIYLSPSSLSVQQGSTVNLEVYINTALANVLGFTLELDGVSGCAMASNLGDDFWAVLHNVSHRLLIMTKDTSVSIPQDKTDGTNPVATLSCAADNQFDIIQSGISKIVWRESGANKERDALFLGAQITIASQAVCGNNVKETGEECDGADLAGQTCVSKGFDSGTLICTVSCTFDTSSCTKKKKENGGGGGGTPVVPPPIIIEPIAPQILEERQKPIIRVTIPESSLRAICPKDGELTVEIENINVPVQNVDVSVEFSSDEIPQQNPYFRTKISSGWHNSENGVFITGAVPSASELFETRLLENREMISSIGEKQKVEANFDVAPSMIGIGGELKVTVTRDGNPVDEQIRTIDIPNPESAVIAEQDGDSINLYTYVAEKSNIEVAFNAEGRKARGPGFLGLFDSLLMKTSHSRFADLQENLEPGLYGQRFSKTIEIDTITGHATDTETNEEIGTVECLDRVCEFPYDYIRDVCSREQILNKIN